MQLLKHRPKPSGRAHHGAAGESVAFSAASTFWHGNNGGIMHITIYVNSVCVCVCVCTSTCVCTCVCVRNPLPDTAYPAFFGLLNKVSSSMSCYLVFLFPHDIILLSKNRRYLASKYFLPFCEVLKLSLTFKIFSVNVSALENFFFFVSSCF